MLKVLWRYWFFVLIVCLLCYVSFANLHQVEFTLLWVNSYELRLAEIIIASFFVGVSCTVLYVLFDWLKTKLQIRKLNKKIVMLEDIIKDKNSNKIENKDSVTKEKDMYPSL